MAARAPGEANHAPFMLRSVVELSNPLNSRVSPVTGRAFAAGFPGVPQLATVVIPVPAPLVPDVVAPPSQILVSARADDT